MLPNFPKHKVGDGDGGGAAAGRQGAGQFGLFPACGASESLLPAAWFTSKRTKGKRKRKKRKTPASLA